MKEVYSFVLIILTYQIIQASCRYIAPVYHGGNRGGYNWYGKYNGFNSYGGYMPYRGGYSGYFPSYNYASAYGGVCNFCSVG